MKPLDKITALITGSSRGMGSAIARKCVEHGARVILHYGQNHAAIEQLQDELGPAVLGTLSVDLSCPGAGHELWRKASDISADINALVNNAGTAISIPFSADDAQWQDGWIKTMAVNLQSPAELCQGAVNSFAQAGGGRIVNIASRAGQRGDHMDFAAYAASKGALIALTQTIAKGAARQNISAYSIAPGWVDTDMAPSDPQVRAAAMDEIPLGRFADPQEVAALVAFLLSDGCRSSSGATFDVNGASYLR